MKLHFKPSEQPRSYTVHQWQCDPLRLSATGEKLRVKHYTAVPNITRTVGVQPPELTHGPSRIGFVAVVKTPKETLMTVWILTL